MGDTDSWLPMEPQPTSSCSAASSLPWTPKYPPDGALAIRGDAITALGPRAQISAAYHGATLSTQGDAW
jgi:hypothetical protein